MKKKDLFFVGILALGNPEKDTPFFTISRKKRFLFVGRAPKLQFPESFPFYSFSLFVFRWQQGQKRKIFCVGSRNLSFFVEKRKIPNSIIR